jgi:hypothetical protein
MNLANRPDIIDVKAILKDGTEISLEQKQLGSGKPSQCTWVGQFPDGDFRIVLRLDWDDIRENDDPTLDADISYKDEKYTTGWKKWHQTSKTFDRREWVYCFAFGSVKLRFKLGVTSQRHIQATARILADTTPYDSQNDYPQWALRTRNLFCAACQAVTAHNFTIDRNKEFIASCHCGRFLKFPPTQAEETLEAFIGEHNNANHPFSRR